MKSVMDNVREFHIACDVPVLDKPQIPDRDRIQLRIRLLAEEYREWIGAVDDLNVVEIADALADMVYIIAGTALEFGIPLEKIFAEVHRSNMTKIDPVTGKVNKRADGKVVKPVGWSPPNLVRIIHDEIYCHSGVSAESHGK